MVLRDERSVCPAGAYSSRYGVALSLPSVVGSDGVMEVIWPAMSSHEAEALERSAETIRNALKRSLGTLSR
jgi:L-lactate dehydrogenase